MSKVKDAAGALEYLMLGPDEKINYRAERGLSIQELYENFTPEPLGKDFFKRKEVVKLFGLWPRRFKKLVEAGVFGESEYRDKKRFFPANKIEELRKRKAKLVSVQEFKEILRKGRWYISPVNEFTKRFGVMYEHFLESRDAYVSILNAARITQQMRQRKEMIEKWPRLQDLNEQSGMNLSRGDMSNRYTKMIQAGELDTELVGIYNDNGEQIGGKERVIPPYEFQRVLPREKVVAHALKFGVTKVELARRLGVNQEYASSLMRAGEITGVLHPVHIGFTDSQSQRYRVLLPEEADALVEGRIKVPNPKRIYYLGRELEGEALETEIQNEVVRAQVSQFGVTVAEIAERTGLSKNGLAKTIRTAKRLGLISPLADSENVLGFNNRQYFLSSEDAEGLVNGSINVPSPRHIRRIPIHKELTDLALGSVPRSFEWDLWQRLQEGDSSAFSILSNLYKPVLDELAAKRRFGLSYEDRRANLESALFEVVAEERRGKLSREVITLLLEMKLVEIIKAEKPSWMSLDKRISSGSDTTYVDIIADKGGFF